MPAEPDEIRPQLFNEDERRQIVAALRANKALDHIRQTRPGWLFAPHLHGQLQALCSDHTFRILIPGNGWGKTRLMAVDADLLMQRDDPYKPQTMPLARYGQDRPTTAIWFCQKYQQYEMMRPEFEREVFTRGWTWRGQQNYYIWPNGSRMFLLSADSDWEAVQGVHIDKVYFDEHPDRKFWNEMMYRRRGRYKTSYMVAATMTLGITWFVTEVIQPWEEYNRRMGRTNDEALEIQDHKTTFCWNVGGIEDNPSMDKDDLAHYESIRTASPKEREVRVHGGYADFTGEPVFDVVPLREMEERATEGEGGAFVFKPDEDNKLMNTLRDRNTDSSMTHRFHGAMDRELFEWRKDMPIEAGRITIYEHPQEKEAGNYIIGGDFAAGLVGLDLDAAIVGRKLPGGQVVQVAEATGYWGDVFFAEVLFALGIYYYEAFIVGERQFGLPCLRRLYDEMGYTYLYYQRHETSRARRFSDILGHHRSAGDTIIPNLRLAVRKRDIVMTSKETITQLRRYQFKPRRTTDTIDDVENSSGLTTGAPAGEHDDLVMGTGYMVHGAREVIHYKKPERLFKRGSYGEMMDVEGIFDSSSKAAQDPYHLKD